MIKLLEMKGTATSNCGFGLLFLVIGPKHQFSSLSVESTGYEWLSFDMESFNIADLLPVYLPKHVLVKENVSQMSSTK